MAFKAVSSNRFDVKRDLPIGEAAQGYYLGALEVKTKHGSSKVHSFKTDKGKLEMWGFASLNGALEEVTLGNLVRITRQPNYISRGKECCSVLVEEDNEDSISIEDEPEDDHVVLITEAAAPKVSSRRTAK